MLKTISISKGTTLVLYYIVYIVYSLGRMQERRRSKYSKGEMKFLASLECSSAQRERERVRILLFCQLNPPWLVDEGEEGPKTASVQSTVFLKKNYLGRYFPVNA